MKTLKIKLLTTTLGLVLVSSSCSVSGPLREDVKASGYKLGTLSSDWQPLKSSTSGADAVFMNSKTKALISVNSVCDRYPDSSLESLSEDLLSPIKSAQVTEQKELMVSSRQALFTAVQGNLDGVPVVANLVVLRKNRCLFDFSIYGKSLLADQKDAFLKFVLGFKFQEPK